MRCRRRSRPGVAGTAGETLEEPFEARHALAKVSHVRAELGHVRAHFRAQLSDISANLRTKLGYVGAEHDHFGADPPKWH